MSANFELLAGYDPLEDDGEDLPLVDLSGVVRLYDKARKLPRRWVAALGGLSRPAALQPDCAASR